MHNHIWLPTLKFSTWWNQSIYVSCTIMENKYLKKINDNININKYLCDNK